MNDLSYKNNWYSASDLVLARVIGDFIRANRIQKNLTQEAVSAAAGISRSTLSLLERGETVTIMTLLQVLRTLELLHIMETFIIPQQISPLKIAKQQHKKRIRATNNDPIDNTNQSDW